MEKMIRCSALASLLVFLLSTGACSPNRGGNEEHARRGFVLSSVPKEIEKEQRYLFYLHGAIIEEQGVRPVSPEFGVYEYEAILDSLAVEGFVVISEVRGPHTDGKTYAHKVAAQIDTLLAAGVAPEHVSVVGFSKGGGIAVIVASLVENNDVNYVFMATCVNWIRAWPRLNLRGRILSVYEASDNIAGSCADAFRAMGLETEHVELELHIGEGHGSFYRPRSEWLAPVFDWLTERG